MGLPVRIPFHPAQCYAPSPDQGFEGRRGVQTSRQPLQESTGNIQHHPHMAWLPQHLEALSSIPPLIPPVLRTQSLGTEYGTPAYPRTQQRHEQHRHGRRRQQGVNPLMPLLTQAFQNYRKKQADKPDQKWPDVLEGPFLDALLLIPQMRRKKYTMKQTQYGRNMLIGEYLWIAYCQSLPPGTEPDPQLELMRERKKVSSHIQVLKNFFSNHRCFHFFFGQRQEDKEKDAIETVSLKNNSVLIALSEGRLPDERPNYEYFAQILALNEQVQFRPKRCWIFVSHKDVVVGEDGTGYLPSTSGKLSEGEYPHLGRNLERETWAKEEQQFFKGALLHEFTKEMHQGESSSVRGLSKKWESAFPDLHQRLKSVTSTTTDARCDMLHLHATLELKEKPNFPSGSSLSSWVEVNIEQPRLLNHRWKVETRLARPDELSYSHDDSAPTVIHEQHKEFTIKYQHRPGCDGSRNEGRSHCDCLSQRSRRDGVMVPFPVPFPADAWAQTLTNCAEYPAHPFSESKRHDRERGAADDEEGPRPRRRSKQPTQMDLVPKIAMMQEIFSCPPTSPHEESSADSANQQRWTRRAVILWTFETIHSLDEKGKLVTAQGGRTNWRFLTVLDPASDYHQRNAIVSGRRASADDYREGSSSFTCGSRPASRGPVMSPSPNYQQHLNASMNENFSSAWDTAGGLGSLSSSAAQAAYGAHFMPQTIPSHAAAGQAGYGLLESFSSHGGLSTPPPSASLASSFAQSFDTASTSSDMLPGYMAAHAAVTTAGMDSNTHTLGGSLSAMTDPFLAHAGAAYGDSHDGIHGWNSHSIVGSIDSAASWSSGYSGTNTGHGLMNWTGSQPHGMSSRRGSEQHHAQGQNPSQHRQQERQQPWVSTANAASIDSHDPWTPLTSADTPAETATAAMTRAGSHDHHHHSHHHHHHHHHHQSSTSKREASQDWVHIHESSTASGSDLSQDWEEVPTLPGTGTGTETMTDHSSSPAPPEVVVEMQLTQHGFGVGVGGGDGTGSQGMMKSLKRGRSDSFGDDGGYRDRRLRG